MDRRPGGAEQRLARDRLATARDIARDVQRRVELGDIPETEALLTRNEELAAALDCPARRRSPRRAPPTAR